MADRLISTEKLKEAIQKNICEMSCDEPRGCSYCKASDVWDVIYEQPTVDAVEVVRCKNCKYFDHSDFGKGEEYWCKHFVSIYDITYCHKVTEDDYCAWGERKEVD